MANILKNFLGYLKLGEDDDYDDYVNDYDEKEEAREEKRRAKREEVDDSLPSRPEKPARKEKSTRTFGSKSFDEDEEELQIPVSETRKERTQRLERERGGAKVVPIRTTPKGLEVCIMKPTSFEDSQDICDMLLTGRAAVVNLEGFDPTEAQRIMDFISGCVYAINGKLHQISRYIFIFSPDSVDISGDYLEFIPEAGFGVPTINKEF